MTTESDGAPELEKFAAAARWCTSPVSMIGDEQWDGPGLGAWDLRGLVGHTGRAFLTLETALDQPTDEVALPNPEDYFAAILSQPGVDDLSSSTAVISLPLSARIRRSPTPLCGILWRSPWNSRSGEAQAAESSPR